MNDLLRRQKAVDYGDGGLQQEVTQMVHGDADVIGPARLDAVQVCFDEDRLISDAGLLVTATLADRLGIEALVNESVWLGYGTPGAALPGREVMTLIAGCWRGRTASMTWTCCGPGPPAWCSGIA